MFEGLDPKELGRYVAIGQVGMEMVMPILIGLAVDHYLGWTPWAVIAGAVLGFFGGIAHLIYLVNRLSDERDRHGPGGDRP